MKRHGRRFNVDRQSAKRHDLRSSVVLRSAKHRDHRFNVVLRYEKRRDRRFNVVHQPQLRLNIKTGNRPDNRKRLVAAVAAAKQKVRSHSTLPSDAEQPSDENRWAVFVFSRRDCATLFDVGRRDARAPPARCRRSD